MTDLNAYMYNLGRRARGAAREIAGASRVSKDAALSAAAIAIRDCALSILETNANETEKAEAAGLSKAFLDRMRLDASRLESIAKSLENIASLPDPVGETIRSWTRPNGLKIERVRVPIGVIAVIYESRPNVTIDAAAIAVKAGNAVILRGGSECAATAGVLHECFVMGLKDAGLPEHAAQYVQTTDRLAVGALLSGLDGAIDVVIPRGGKSLVARVETEAKTAVLSHLDGICHVYVDKNADPEKAVAIVVNAKMRRPGVCGAAETLLIDKARLNELTPALLSSLQEAGCEIRADDAVRSIYPRALAASPEDWETEYLAPVISIAAVESVEGAIAHIARYGSGHTDAIVTEDKTVAARFVNQVDSAIVMHNASTQFADGGEFGLGAEIGIATGRLHARGPVGLEELTTYKNVVHGEGQVRP
ncbi:MAG: glutamate-5-semialdehyde dehydrogenase [Pseudomonadota bacterium]